MHHSNALFIEQEQTPSSEQPSIFAFVRCCYDQESSSGLKDIDASVYRVARRPSDLMAHLQRIYACYLHGSSEQLYAGLIDFLSVLRGRGRSLSVRMIKGCRARLEKAQFIQLMDYLSNPLPHKLSDNHYTIIKQATVGTPRLMAKSDGDQPEQDVMQLVRDYIEYSQLEPAMHLLEQSILKTPDRIELQAQLMELYRVTVNKQRYTEMSQRMQQTGIQLNDVWKDFGLSLQ